MQDARVTLIAVVRERPISCHCDRFVPEDRAKWRKRSELQKIRNELTDSWQKDLVELMSVSEVAIYFFKTAAGFNHSPTPPFSILAYSVG